MLIGIAIEIPFALGELLLGIEAYFIRDWVTLQIVAYIPLIGQLQDRKQKSCSIISCFSSPGALVPCPRISPVAPEHGPGGGG